MQGIPIILTRPAGSNSDFMAQIPAPTAVHLTPVDSPLLRIDPIDQNSAIEESTVAIFTSVNGVRYAPPASGRRAYCVGMRTTEKATAVGWKAVCAGQTASELVNYFVQNRPRGPFIHLSGTHVRGDIVQSLCDLGMTARPMPIYDQVLVPLSDAALAVLNKQTKVIVPLFSPRAAAHFAAVCPSNNHVRLVALSDAVAQSAGDIQKFDTMTADFPTTAALVQCIENVVSEISLG